MTAPRYRLIAMHGFLGSVADWGALPAVFSEAHCQALDLWELFAGRAVKDWSSLGHAVATRLGEMLREGPALPTFLVGYSMGARLALSIPGLGSEQSPCAGVCLISCHPGFPEDDEQARSARIASDEKWAERFIDAPVQRIWKEWDAQTAFAGSAVPPRANELPAPRVTLARAMRLASLGRQPDRRPALLGWRRPLLWLSGERDAKFRAIAARLEADGVPATFVTCEHAGHRVPWDNPSLFVRILHAWIDSVLAGGGADARQ